MKWIRKRNIITKVYENSKGDTKSWREVVWDILSIPQYLCCYVLKNVHPSHSMHPAVYGTCAPLLITVSLPFEMSVINICQTKFRLRSGAGNPNVYTKFLFPSLYDMSWLGTPSCWESCTCASKITRVFCLRVSTHRQRVYFRIRHWSVPFSIMLIRGDMWIKVHQNQRWVTEDG